MFEKMTNEKNVSVKMTRGELVDLIILCAAHFEDGEKWIELHDKLIKNLNALTKNEAR